jgi:hypothetical protein
MARPRLTTELAAELYQLGWSACQIADHFKVTPSGAESKIRAAGLGGLQWCPLCLAFEEIKQGGLS